MKKRFVVSTTSIMIIAVTVLAVAGLAIGAVKWHETPGFCAAFCHNMKPYLASYTGERKSQDGTALLAQSHALQGITCLNCHEAKVDQQVQELITYVKGDYPTPLEQRAFPDDFCLRCHGTREDVIARTANYQVKYTISADLQARLAAAGYDLSQHTNINPHSILLNTANPNNPHGAGATLIQCSRCHSMHNESPKLDTCYSCHHTETFAPCKTCHTSNP